MMYEGVRAAYLIPLLWKRKWMILISALSTACVAFAVAKVLPLQYASEGSLILENPASVADPTSPSITNGVLTQIDVLQSAGLVRRVIVQHQLAETAGLKPTFRLPPEIIKALQHSVDQVTTVWHELTGDPRTQIDTTDTLVKFVQKHLQAKAKESSSVITVKFVAGSPEAASTVANSIMDTYISTMRAARDAQIATAEAWIAQQTEIRQREIDLAQQRVTQFMEAHALPEVQGSLTAAIVLSKLQAQLGEAREALAREQAALDTLPQKDSGAAAETLASRTIQKLKELEAVATEKINQLSPTDPRRIALQASITSLQARTKTETDLISGSIARELEIGRARVAGLEKAVQDASKAARTTSVEGTVRKLLTDDLEAKRQGYVDFVKQIGLMRVSAQQAPSAHLLFPAVSPQHPMLAYGALSLVLGFVAGTLGAAATIGARNTLRRKIISGTDMEGVTGIPVLGCLPNLNRPATAKSVLVAETLRGAWLSLRPRQAYRGEGTSVIVTSGEVGEGKTTVALALASRIAADGFRVLLIDGDLRRSKLSSLLRLPTMGQGCLEDVLAGAVSFNQAVQHHTETGLDCILARGDVSNPMRLLLSSELSALCTEARKCYDFVLVDSPPVLRVADATLLARHAENIILVVEAGRLADDLVLEAIGRFAGDDQRKMRALLTRVRRADLSHKDYYGGYQNLRLT